MLKVGLTGNIASGKSSVARVWKEQGATIVDADELARRAVEPGTPALARIAERWGSRVLAPDGTLDRAALREIVFADEEERRALEAIVHPAVAEARRAFLRRHAGHRIVLLDIPLLFEKGIDAEMDAVVVVSAPAHVQRRRVLRRPGMSQARLRALLASQLPDRMKRAGAHAVISTARPKWQTRAAVARLLACLRRSQGR